MKRIILTLILTTALVATDAKAQQVRTCVGGTEFQGTENKHYYCRGPAMTWWAAFAWCQKQNRHLASLDEACADWRNDTSDIQCPNMKVSTDINGMNMASATMWTATPAGVQWAYQVISGSGSFYGVRDPHGKRSYSNRALCY